MRRLLLLIPLACLLLLPLLPALPEEPAAGLLRVAETTREAGAFARTETLTSPDGRFRRVTRVELPDSGGVRVTRLEWLDGRALADARVEITIPPAGRGLPIRARVVPVATALRLARELERKGLEGAAMLHAREARQAAANMTPNDPRRLDATALVHRLEARQRDPAPVAQR
jgi:hypothetical protein